MINSEKERPSNIQSKSSRHAKKDACISSSKPVEQNHEMRKYSKIRCFSTKHKLLASLNVPRHLRDQ